MVHGVTPCEKQYAAMASTSLAILVVDENRIPASIIEADLSETRHDNVTVVHDITGVRFDPKRTVATLMRFL